MSEPKKIESPRIVWNKPRAVPLLWPPISLTKAFADDLNEPKAAPYKSNPKMIPKLPRNIKKKERAADMKLNLRMLSLPTLSESEPKYAAEIAYTILNKV